MVKFINKKKFAPVVLSLNIKIFVIYMLALEVKILIDLLDKIIILIKYLDYIDIFSPKYLAKFLKYNNSN